MHSSSNPLIHSSGGSSSGRADSSAGVISGINRLPQTREAEGINLEELPIGAVIEVETAHTTYRLENKGEGNALLSGHPKYCPEPTALQVQGSLNQAGELQWRYLGRGMKMVFLPPDHGIVHTSSIKVVRRVPAADSN